MTRYLRLIIIIIIFMLSDCDYASTCICVSMLILDLAVNSIGS